MTLWKGIAGRELQKKGVSGGLGTTIEAEIREYSNRAWKTVEVFMRDNLKRLRKQIWTSAIYRRGRRTLAMMARPFAIFEIATIYRNDLTAPLAAFAIEADLWMGEAAAEEVERA